MLGECRLNPARLPTSSTPQRVKTATIFVRHVPREREKSSLFGNNYVCCERSEPFFSRLQGDGMAEKIVSESFKGCSLYHYLSFLTTCTFSTSTK